MVLGQQNRPLNNLHLAIDPSSNCMGVSLWFSDGTFFSSSQITTPTCVYLSERLYLLRKKFEEWFQKTAPNGFVTSVVVERISQRQMSYALLYSAGAVLALPFIKAKVGVKDQLVPPVWKKHVRLWGSHMSDPKGVPALKGIGWKTNLATLTEDEADSIMLYLGWRAENKMPVNFKQ